MSLSEVAHTPRGIATIVLECVSYAAMMPFLYMEYRTIVEYWDDWLNAWNAIDVLVYSLQVRSFNVQNLCLTHGNSLQSKRMTPCNSYLVQ